MTAKLEKGGATFEGIKLLLCENPLPPLDEAISAAQAELARSNYYTEPHSEPLRRLIAEQLGVPERLIHINAGSELILRQIFDRLGDQVHLLTPTYALFSEIARRYTETRLLPERDFAFDLSELEIPGGTSLAVIVNPNDPNGGTFDMRALPHLLARYAGTRFLVDEAFIGLGDGDLTRVVLPAAQDLDLLVLAQLRPIQHLLRGREDRRRVEQCILVVDLFGHSFIFSGVVPCAEARVRIAQSNHPCQMTALNAT